LLSSPDDARRDPNHGTIDGALGMLIVDDNHHRCMTDRPQRQRCRAVARVIVAARTTAVINNVVSMAAVAVVVIVAAVISKRQATDDDARDSIVGCRVREDLPGDTTPAPPAVRETYPRRPKGNWRQQQFTLSSDRCCTCHQWTLPGQWGEGGCRFCQRGGPGRRRGGRERANEARALDQPC
jgi:hypothetical protein